MGAAVGREAALKQAGALVGGRLSVWFRFTPDQRQLLVACGAGAGMAAAYNVPFAGALFTLEVLLGTLSLQVAVAALTSCFLAVAVSWLMLPNVPTYSFPTLPVTPGLMLFALLAGPLLGLIALAFTRGVRWARSHKLSRANSLWLPLVVLTTLGLAAGPFPQLLGNGKNAVQLAFDLRMGTPLLAWLLVLRPLATVLCLRAGVPGGLFTPSMTLGALAGGLLGQGFSYLAPATDKRGYALLGAHGVLAAATQAPVSSVAFALETRPERSCPGGAFAGGRRGRNGDLPAA